MFSPDDPTTPLPSLLRAPWWLRVASASPRIPQRTIAERELARRSDLIAWLSLGVLIATLSLSFIALDDVQALIALSGIVLRSCPCDRGKSRWAGHGGGDPRRLLHRWRDLGVYAVEPPWTDHGATAQL